MTLRHAATCLATLLVAAQCPSCKSCNEGEQHSHATTVRDAIAAPTTTIGPDVVPAIAPPPTTPQPALLEGTNPTGCVGWSPTSGRVACVEGHWGHNVEGASWALVLRSASAHTAIDLAPGRDFPAAGAVTDDPLSEDKLKAAQRRLTGDSFVSIPAGVTLRTTKTELPGGASVTYDRTNTSAAGDNQAPTYRERIVVRFADSREVVLHTADNAATGDPGPDVRMYAIPGGPVVIYRRANIADEGQYEVEARAWVCDLAAGRCG